MALPARGVAQGGPDRWPVTYSAGAPGWTADFLSPPYVAGSAYQLDVPSSAEPFLGAVAAGRTRVLILGIGESGMVGANDVSGPFPAGYPRPDGTLWSFNACHCWVPLTEPTHDPGSWGTAEPAFNVLASDCRVSFGGMFCWLLQAALGVSYEVGFVPCGHSGASTLDWAVASATSYCATAIARARLALTQPRTLLGAIIHEQGINDARYGLSSVTGWAARWTAIEMAIRAALGGTTCPLYYSLDCPTRPTIDQMSDASWAQLASEKASWASSRRFGVQKPDGPFYDGTQIHLATSAQAVLAQSYMDAWTAHPGVTA